MLRRFSQLEAEQRAREEHHEKLSREAEEKEVQKR
jgi:hypothetical protein